MWYVNDRRAFRFIIQLLSQRDVKLDAKTNESNSQSIFLKASSRIRFVRLANIKKIFQSLFTKLLIAYDHLTVFYIIKFYSFFSWASTSHRFFNVQNQQRESYCIRGTFIALSASSSFISRPNWIYWSILIHLSPTFKQLSSSLNAQFSNNS